MRLTAWIVLAVLTLTCSPASVAGNWHEAAPGPNLVGNASMEELDKDGLPKGYEFAGPEEGVRISVEPKADGPHAALKVRWTNKTDQRLTLRLPWKPIASPKGGCHYFLGRFRVKTTEKATVNLSVSPHNFAGGNRSQTVSARHWVTVNVPMEYQKDIGWVRMTLANHGEPGAVWLRDFSVVALTKEQFKQLFINRKWQVLGAQEAAKVPPGKRNLLVNSSFELDTDGIENPNGESTTTSICFDGTRSTGSLGAGHEQFYTCFHRFTPGRRYTLSAWIYAHEPNTPIEMDAVSGCMEAFRDGYSYDHWPRARLKAIARPEWKRISITFVPGPDPTGDGRHTSVTDPAVKSIWATWGYIWYGMYPKSAMRIRFGKRSGPRAYVDCMQLEEGGLSDYKLANPVQVGAILHKSDSNDRIYYENDQISMTCRLFSREPGARQVETEFIVKDIYGRTVATHPGQNVTLDPKTGRARYTMTFSPPGRGLYKIIPNARMGDLQVIGEEKAFGSVSPEVMKRPYLESSFLGLHSAGFREFRADPPFDKCYLCMKKIGFKWQRLVGNPKWSTTEPEQDKFVWHDKQLFMGQQDAFLKIGSFYNTPDWLGGSSFKNINDHIDDWRDYVYQTVNHYKDKIHYWEIWNEPYRSDPDNFANMQRVAAEAAKQADPSCKILGFGGWSLGDDPKGLSFLEKVYAATHDVIDVVAIHGYSGIPDEMPRGLAERLQELRSIMAKYGTIKPIWDTETGMACGSFYSDRIDGSDNLWNRVKTEDHVGWPSNYEWEDGIIWAVRTCVVGKANGMEKLNYHFNALSPGETTMNAANVGEYDHSPKSMLMGFATFAYLLDPSEFVEKIQIQEDVPAYLFKAGGKGVAVLWRVYDRKKKPATVTFSTGPVPVEVFDVMSNPHHDAKRAGGALTLPLAGNPVFLRAADCDALAGIVRSARLRLRRN